MNQIGFIGGLFRNYALQCVELANWYKSNVCINQWKFVFVVLLHLRLSLCFIFRTYELAF